MSVSKRVAIALDIICIFLVICLIGVFTVYSDYVSNHTHNDSEFSALTNSYDNLENQIQQLRTWLNGNVTSSYNSGYKAGAASRGFDIVDPTYQQLISFMSTDTVHNNVYKNGTYICWNFCNDYIKAFRAGWRCGFVYISFPSLAHGVVCFNTTNKGIVFVEPQLNQIISVTIGSSYSRSNGLTPVTYNDTIVSFGIIW